MSDEPFTNLGAWKTNSKPLSKTWRICWPICQKRRLTSCMTARLNFEAILLDALAIKRGHFATERRCFAKLQTKFSQSRVVRSRHRHFLVAGSL